MNLHSRDEKLWSTTVNHYINRNGRRSKLGAPLKKWCWIRIRSTWNGQTFELLLIKSSLFFFFWVGLRIKILLLLSNSESREKIFLFPVVVWVRFWKIHPVFTVKRFCFCLPSSYIGEKTNGLFSTLFKPFSAISHHNFSKTLWHNWPPEATKYLEGEHLRKP